MMDVLARTTMKAAVECDKHCELHDSVNHLKVERILFLKTRFLSVFIVCLSRVCVCSRVRLIVDVCVGVCLIAHVALCSAWKCLRVF